MLSDYQTLVTDLVRDDAAKIQTAERDRAIQLAARRYSKDRERIKVEDLTPTDANTLPLPASWEADHSEMRSLEFPIGRIPPVYLEQGRWAFYDTPSAQVIKTLDAVAVAANAVRSRYTITHVLSSSVDTIPVGDREPVACWAAAILCDELAAFYSGQSDSTIQADSVQAGSRAQEFAKRAVSLRKRYENELGVNDRRNVAGGTVVNLDMKDSQGLPRLTHPMRRLYS